MEINFTREPRKSRRQLQKLLELVQNKCKTKVELSVQRKHEAGDQVLDARPQEATSRDAELAQLALAIFGSSTSVLYDIAAISDMIQSDSSGVSALLLSNLLFLSLNHIYQGMHPKAAHAQLQPTFAQLWRLSTNCLSLPRMA